MINRMDLLGVSLVAMQMIYKILWNKLPRKSFISGLWLRDFENTPIFPNCFLHVLPPDKYPYFKYYFKNIILASPGEAGLWIQASEEERITYALEIEASTGGKNTARWDDLKRLEASLIVDYGKVFPRTRGMLLDYRYSLEEQKEIIGKLNKKFFDSLKK